MAGEKRLLMLGQISYWLLLIAIVTFLCAGVVMYTADVRQRSSGLVTAAMKTVSGLFTGDWIPWILEVARWLYHHPPVLVTILTFLTLAYVLQLIVDEWLDRDYSEFWHTIRRALRKELGF